jgi:hypothetical protein
MSHVYKWDVIDNVEATVYIDTGQVPEKPGYGRGAESFVCVLPFVYGRR